MNTHWSTPKTNVFAALNDLRKALSHGQNARLVKARNQDCAYSIKVKHEDQDFKNYDRMYGKPSSINKIKARKGMSDFQKELSLNYVLVYGTPEAMQTYYETRELSADNFNGIGRAHLVHVDDMIEHLTTSGDLQRANRYKLQYRGGIQSQDTQNFFDFYSYKHGSQWSAKKFKRRVWVVEVLKADQPKARIPVMIYVLNFIMFPLKFVPKKSVLRMKKYKIVTLRIGSVRNGLAIEFHVPKKFGFK